MNIDHFPSFVLARDAAGSATTKYAYSSATGEVTGIDYPALDVADADDVYFTYTRLGQLKTVDDATGLRTFKFRTGDFLADRVDLPGFFGAGRRVTYDYYGTNGAGRFIGKPKGLQYGTSTDPGAFYGSSYDYEAATGRLASAQLSGTTFTYAFEANSNLIQTITGPVIGTNSFTRNRVYETYRHLLTAMETKLGATSLARYAYRHNDLGQRTDVTQTGSLYDRYGSPAARGLVRRFAYDSRGELIKEDSDPDNDPVPITYAALPGRTYEYGYDRAGNRAFAKADNNSPNTYAANEVNAYSSRDVPNNLFVSVLADADAVIVNAVAASSDNEYYYRDLSVSNAGADVYQHVVVEATKNGAGTGGSDAVAKREYDKFVPAHPETPTHDADGNLTRDGLWDYVYDAGSRLPKSSTGGSNLNRP